MPRAKATHLREFNQQRKASKRLITPSISKHEFPKSYIGGVAAPAPAPL